MRYLVTLVLLAGLTGCRLYEKECPPPKDCPTCEPKRECTVEDRVEALEQKWRADLEEARRVTEAAIERDRISCIQRNGQLVIHYGLDQFLGELSMPLEWECREQPQWECH